MFAWRKTKLFHSYGMGRRVRKAGGLTQKEKRRKTHLKREWKQWQEKDKLKTGRETQRNNRGEGSQRWDGGEDRGGNTAPWTAYQSRRWAAAPDRSSQHLLLPHSQVKHIIPADSLLNGFCGGTFPGSMTASADAQGWRLLWNTATLKGFLILSLPTQDDTSRGAHTQAQLSYVQSIPSSLLHICLRVDTFTHLS